MKTKLNVGERMMVLTVLPKEGSFVTIRLIRTLISRLALSAQEIQDFEIVQEQEALHFNSKGSIELDFDFADVEFDLIRKQLKELDEGCKLKPDMITIYQKFCT